MKKVLQIRGKGKVRRRKFLKEGDKAFTGKGRVKPENAEIRKLRKDLEKAREERDILKKALAVFSKQNR